MSGAFRSVDRHWPSVLWFVGIGLVGGGYALWTYLAENDPLLARLEADTRTTLYGSLSSSAGALLGFTIAALAILFTLDPSRPLVARAQAHQLWTTLNKTLLAAAAALAVLLVAATTALAIDASREPCLWIEGVVFTISVVALLELVVAGFAFALVVITTASSPPQRDS